MDTVVSDPVRPEPDQRQALLALYGEALPVLYGYLIRRCGSAGVAEELTSEAFLAAVGQIRRQRVTAVTLPWLIGIARHKLVDHWRRQEVEQRALALVELDDIEDHWDATLVSLDALATLANLAPHHRGALTLRYLDGLSVPEVADHLRRTVGATEVLLVRARRAFRAAYEVGHTEEAP